MARKGEDKLYQFVDDLVAVGARELMAKLGLAEDGARETMTSIAHAICTMYARSYMYVPVNMRFSLAARNEQIWQAYGEDSATARKYTARRVAELAEQHEMTTQQMYNILRAEAAAEQAERQPLLPGLDGDATDDGAAEAV